MNNGAPAATPEDLDALAGEYVLGTLDGDARHAVQARLPHDPLLRVAVAQWEARLAPLAGLAEPEAPGDALWPRIAASLEREARAPKESRWSFWSRVGFWRSLAGVALAGAAFLAVVLFTRPLPVDYVVVLVAPGTAEPTWTIQSVDDRTVQVIPLAGAPETQGYALELWTRPHEQADPVSLGRVDPGRSLRLPLRELPSLRRGQWFELTLEPTAGATAGQPSGPVQAAGRAVHVM